VTALVPYRSRKTRTTARFDDRKHRVAEGRATTEHVSMRGRESVSRIVMAGRIDAPFDAPFVLSDSLPGDAVALVIEFGSVRFDIPRSAVRSKRDKIRVDGRTIDGLRSVTIDTRRGRWKLNSDPLDRVLLYGPDEDPEQRLDCIEIALQVQTSVGLVRFDTFYEVPHDGP
jgi:hypothetical protein